jgi:phage gpG-like protein
MAAKEFDVHVVVEIDGIDETLEYLEDVRKRMRDLRPIWPGLQQSLKRYSIANFTAQGLPSGGWRPLDAEYASWKSGRFPGAPILVQTGKLFRQVLEGPKLDGARDNASFSFEGRIAKFHQYGTTKMPARPVLFAPEVWVDEAVDTMADYIVGGLARSR